MNQLEQVVVLNFLPDSSKVDNIHHINVLVERAVHSVIHGAVKAAETSVTTKSHEVGATSVCLIEVPVFV